MNLHRTEQHTFIGLAPAGVNKDSSDRAILWGPIFFRLWEKQTDEQQKMPKKLEDGSGSSFAPIFDQLGEVVEVVWQPCKKIDETETLTGEKLCNCQT